MKRGLFLLAIVLLLVVPASFAFAQGALPDRIVPCGGVDCGWCDLVQLAQNLINIGIFITIALSAMTFAYAGFLYLSGGGNPGKIAKARGMFTKVAVGLMIILGAWLGVDTLMKTVVRNDADFGPWNSMGCGGSLQF